MILAVCATLDRKAKSFGAPMVFQNTEIATRMARTLMEHNGQQSDLEKYPEDFDLYLIGEFDTELGTIAGLETPRFLFTYGDLLARKAAQ